MNKCTQSKFGRISWSGRRLIAAAGTLLGLSLLAAPTSAQVLYGSIVGVVQDASGSSIPAATVTIVSKETNLTRETVSNENGEYTLTNVLPGTYDIKVGLQGFREFVRANVPVTPGQISRVVAKLEIGALAETVTVESSAQLLQTDKTDVHTELKSKEIVNLRSISIGTTRPSSTSYPGRRRRRSRTHKWTRPGVHCAHRSTAPIRTATTRGLTARAV